MPLPIAVIVPSVLTGVGVGVDPSGTSSGGGDRDRDRANIEIELVERGLPEGSASKAVAGYLYFPASIREKKSMSCASLLTPIIST